VYNSVVRFVGVVFGIVDPLAGIRVDVGATDEFDGERPAFFLGDGKLGLQLRSRVLEVGLQSVVDESGAADVVFAHEGDCPAVDASLDGVLLGVDPDAAALGLSFLADLVHGFYESSRRFFVADQSLCYLWACACKSGWTESASVRYSKAIVVATYFMPTQSPFPIISRVSKLPSLH
jgi:hypothetical protein